MALPQRAAGQAAQTLPNSRFLIVEARFYETIGLMLLEGAERALTAAGAAFDRVTVPGALEIPIAAAIALDAAAADGHPYDGVVALGCVIRGETFHFEIVAVESSRALMDLAVARGVPLGNAILTMNTMEQAEARADPKRGDKGGEAARAAIALARLKRAGPRVSRQTKRAAARLGAAQALYQMDVVGKGLNDALAEFEAYWLGQKIEGDTYHAAEVAFFRDIVSGVQKDQLAIDRALDAALAQGWPLARVEALLRAILRAAQYELLHRPDVPAKVVIAQYVDVAAAFFDADICGMVNAVLDRLARSTRAGEFDAQAS